MWNVNFVFKIVKLLITKNVKFSFSLTRFFIFKENNVFDAVTWNIFYTIEPIPPLTFPTCHGKLEEKESPPHISHMSQ